MPNTSMNISLPESLKQYVKKRVAEEHYSNPSDFIRALIREDQKHRDREKLESMLLEGLSSGEGKAMTAADWKKLREDVMTHMKQQEV